MPEVLDQKDRKAREAHTCSYCGDVIEKGEVYHWSKLKYEDQLYEWKAHKKCVSIASDLWDYVDPYNGMTEDDFCYAYQDFCRTFICPDCQRFDKDAHDCEKDLSFCTDKIYELLQTHDFKRTPGRPWEWKLYPKTDEEMQPKKEVQ